MSLTLPRHFGFRFFALSLAFSSCICLPGIALAGSAETQSVVQAITDAGQAETQALIPVINGLGAKVDTSSHAMKESVLTQTVQDIERERTVTPDLHNGLLGNTLNNVPSTLVLVDMAATQVMENRLKELNMVAPNKENESRAAYLIDPTQEGVGVDTEIFEIYMRYFCDPEARNGTMANTGKLPEYKVAMANQVGKSLGCGSIRTAGGGISTAALPNLSGPSSRDAVFGEEPTGNPGSDADGLKEEQRDEIKNLPLRPQDLFFEPDTMPIMPMQANDTKTGTNKLAPVYYGAFAQALQFMIGTTPEKNDMPALDDVNGKARYLEKQGNIARQMLASYPFALLFAERVGTMPAASVGALLQSKIEGSDDSSPLVVKVTDLMQRQNVSLAEYMDLMMYRVPMSKGYLERIRDMSVPDLQREKVWLAAMQNVLNYQRNRWLEILVALEAVK